MNLLDKVKRVLRLGKYGPNPDEVTCVSCDRPVGTKGDVCAACESVDERRYGH